MAKLSPNKSPTNLAGWQSKLRRLELPADPAVKAAALNKLCSPTGNANNVANILQQDPGLSLILINEANKTLAMSGTATHSLAHTLSLIGFPRVETLIRRSPDYNRDNFPHLAEYRQQLSISLHAAHQVMDWSKHKPAWQQQELFWPTLLQRAPFWALWYHAGDAMLQLQQSRANSGDAAHQSMERKILGTSLQGLCAALSRNWHLPSCSQQSWQSRYAGNPRQWIMLSRIKPELAHIAMETIPRLQQVCNSPAFAIALANRLADQTEWDWYSRRSLRLQRVLATALNQPLAETINQCHQQAAEASRQCTIAKVHLPAQQLISHYRKAEQLVEAKTTSTTTTSPQPDKPTATSDLPQSTPPPVKEVLDRLRLSPHSFNDFHEIMNLLVATLCQHIGFERACVNLVNLPKKTLRTYYNAGADDSPALANFQHILQKGDLFNKLLQKPVSVRLERSNYSKIWPLLPGNFKQACGADEFVMMSVFSQRKPVAIIYADHGNSNKPITGEQYTLFQQLCRATSHCLPLTGH